MMMYPLNCRPSTLYGFAPVARSLATLEPGQLFDLKTTAFPQFSLFLNQQNAWTPYGLAGGAVLAHLW